jgi:HSP20 family protein
MKVPVRSHVLRELFGLQDRLKGLFHKVIGRKHRGDLLSYGSFVPLTNIYDKSDALVYELELPGLDRKDLEVTVDENVLAVRGERKFIRDESKANCLWKGSFHGSFATSFALPEWVDTDSIHADCWNGLLRIEAPKQSGACARRIPVSSGSIAAFSKAA